MKKYFGFTVFAVALICGAFGIQTNARAATRPTLALTFLSGDFVEAKVIADPNSPVQISFFKSGSVSPTIISNLGSTDASGNFVTTISSGLYGIPRGASAAAITSDMQSPVVLWPDYGNSGLTLSPTRLQLVPGQSFIVTASGPISINGTLNNSVVTATATQNQLLVYGVAIGTTQLTICQNTVGCVNLPVTVEQGAAGTASSTISLSQNTLTLRNGENTQITIFGGTGGYVLSTPTTSNTSLFTSTINGNILNLEGKADAGLSTLTICSATDATNCATLGITNAAAASASLSLSENNLTLGTGQSKTITVSGGIGGYTVTTNSNPGSAGTSFNGSTLTLQGNQVGAANIVICTQTTPTICTTLYTTTAPTTPSSLTPDSGLVLTIPLYQGQKFPFSILGGTVENFTVTGNTNPSIASATVTGSTLTVTGVTPGHTDISFCQSAAASCGTISVTVRSNAPSVYTFPFVPNVTAQTGTDRVTLAWNQNQTTFDYDGYIVYRSKEAGVRGTEIARLGKGQLSYTDNGTTNATTYYYSVVYYWGGAISNADRPVAATAQ